MFDTDTDIRSIPDDPKRTAAPHQAPGEIEPPEPRELSPAQLRALPAEVERDIMACLKGEQDFRGYDRYGTPTTWTPYDLWVELTNDMQQEDIAATLAAVLDYRPWEENDFIWALRNRIEWEILDPLIKQQVLWRSELAPDETAEQWT